MVVGLNGTIAYGNEWVSMGNDTTIRQAMRMTKNDVVERHQHEQREENAGNRPSDVVEGSHLPKNTNFS